MRSTGENQGRIPGFALTSERDGAVCGNEQDWKERVWGGRGVRIWFWTCEYVNFGMSFGAVRLAECLMLLNVRLPLQGALRAASLGPRGNVSLQVSRGLCSSQSLRGPDE